MQESLKDHVNDIQPEDSVSQFSNTSSVLSNKQFDYELLLKRVEFEGTKGHPKLKITKITNQNR